MPQYYAQIKGHIWEPGIGLCESESPTFSAESHAAAIETVWSEHAGDFQEVVSIVLFKARQCKACWATHYQRVRAKAGCYPVGGLI